MFELMHASSSPPIGAVYVALVWFVCSFVCLNLFLAILVHNYGMIASEANGLSNAVPTINELQLEHEVLQSHASVMVYTPRPVRVDASEEEELDAQLLDEAVHRIARTIAPRSHGNKGRETKLRQVLIMKLKPTKAYQRRQPGMLRSGSSRRFRFPLRSPRRHNSARSSSRSDSGRSRGLSDEILSI